jgi:quinol monooxygenase YgiN
VVIFNVPGGTQEQYDAVLEQLNLSGNMPPGGISHAAGPIEGGWRVVEVWESEEAADAFFREQLDQALRNAGVPEPQLETWTVYKTLEPAVP